jgi:ATP-dependent exoDNAse (exonuclease V) alpha subunit
VGARRARRAAQRDVAAGVEAYNAGGRVTIADTVADQRVALVAAWWRASKAGDRGEVVMLAYRRADVAALNELARARLLADGKLTGPTVYGVDERETVRPFAARDAVVVRRNSYRDGLVNGQRGVVATVDQGVGNIRVRIGDQELTVSAQHLDGGFLDHGYALTVHQAQGLTVDRALLLGSSSLYQLGVFHLRQDCPRIRRPDRLRATDKPYTAYRCKGCADAGH